MTDIQPFQSGAESANDPDETKDATAAERACTKQWLEKIKQARDFDKEARRQYARDRKYARGDDGKFEVSVPIATANIDVLRSFLFAKNPDISCEPAASTQPPPQRELQATARKNAQAQSQQQIQQLAPMIHQVAASGALSGAIQNALPMLQQAMQGGGPDPQDALEQQAQQTAQQQAAPYQQAHAEAKQYAQTMELVVAHLWKQSGLKQQALPLVGSALSVGPGWLKSTWQERTGPNPDPTAQNALNDIQTQLAQVKLLQEELDEGEAADHDATVADLQQKMAGLQAQTEAVIARGLAIDFETAENIQVAPECGPLTNYLQSPWISHRAFIAMDDAKAKFPKVADKLKNAKLYYARKPKDLVKDSADTGAQANVDDTDADAYTTNNEHSQSDKGSVAVWEIWNKDDGMVLTLVEGVDQYACDPYPPNPGTTRFYPFFLYPIGVVDGERHPRSLVARSSKLFDEYNRARSNWRTARNRSIPKTAFNAAMLEPKEAEKLRTATTAEMVGLDLKDPTAKLGDVLTEVKYATINEALYDTDPIMREIEKVWGVQEALTQGVSVAKTATEAEIQQTGTNSRTGYMKDGLDDLFTDFANYTAEIAVQKMDHDDVVRIAGVYAFWPEGMKVADLPTLVEITIRAGSSGKPNTAQRQQAWAVLMPVLQQAIQQIGALRGSSPDDLADCLEELVVETLNRTGDRIDADRFLPEAPAQGKAPPPQGPPPDPSKLCLSGPQIQAMTVVCDQVRQQILAPETAIAILAAGFPNVPMPQIEQMVAGVAKLPPAPPPNPIAVNKTLSGDIPAPEGAASGTVQ